MPGDDLQERDGRRSPSSRRGSEELVGDEACGWDRAPRCAEAGARSSAARKVLRQTRGAELQAVPGQEGGRRGRERGAGREPSGAEARAEKAEAALEGRGARWEGSWPLTPRPRRSGARRSVPPAAAARPAPAVLYSAPVADHTAPAALRPRPAGWTAHS